MHVGEHHARHVRPGSRTRASATVERVFPTVSNHRQTATSKREARPSFSGLTGPLRPPRGLGDRMTRARVAASTPKQYISIARAAEVADVSTRTIYRWIREGHLTAYRFGPSLLRIDLADLDKLAQRVPTA